MPCSYSADTMLPDQHSLHWLKLAANDTPETQRLLGAVDYGLYGDSTADCLVATPVLANFPVARTAWLGRGPVSSGTHGPLHYRHNDDLLFGYLRPESTTNDAGSVGLEQLSFDAYCAIFGLMTATGFPWLARCWNYIPHIHAMEDGLERYQQFNIGRQRAFRQAGQAYLDGAPAASALGTRSGTLGLYFIATRIQPLPIENPRQISAFRYPRRYGPCSPTFSRALLLPFDDLDALFISGTASIVGHESRHPGNASLQTAETLHNIDALVEQANRLARGGGFSSQALQFKAYVRHNSDRDGIAATVHGLLGQDADVTWLEADVCRSELLVEIEAFATRPVQGTPP